MTLSASANDTMITTASEPRKTPMSVSRERSQWAVISERLVRNASPNARRERLREDPLRPGAAGVSSGIGWG